MKHLALICTLWLAALPVYAVEPDEILDDPALEARARTLSKELRCLVCRNENIDSSNAGIARDLRLLVRERLRAGDDDAEVLAYIVARYGEYVLLSPPLSRANLALWLPGPLALLIGLGLAYLLITRRQSPPGALSPDEERRFEALLRNDTEDQE